MKIPDIIKNENVKNTIIFYLFIVIGMLILNNILKYFNAGFSSETMAAVIMGILLIHLIYFVASQKILRSVKFIIMLFLVSIIYMTFNLPFTPIIRKIVAWATMTIVFYLGIKYLIHKIKGDKLK